MSGFFNTSTANLATPGFVSGIATVGTNLAGWFRDATGTRFNLGFGNIGSLNFGLGNVGNWNLGFGNLGSSNIGNGNAGSSNLGSGNLGDNNLGSGNHGSSNIGFGNLGSSNIGWGGTWETSTLGSAISGRAISDSATRAPATSGSA